MKTCVDCIPCFVDHGVHNAKMASADPETVKAMVAKVLDELGRHPYEMPPPFMARKINQIVRAASQGRDLYIEEKDNSTRFAHEVLISIQEELSAQPDQFEAAVRLSIAGNIIDYGVDRTFKLDSAKARIVEAFDAPLDRAAIKSLQNAMERAKDILYITDNCGEAVFDRLLIEPFKGKVTLAVRGQPILNDLTRRELASSGLDGLAAKLIDTGDCTPGVCFEHSSKEFIDAFNSAELIVAKGQGNYETLSDTKRPVFFLFRAKCKVVTDSLGGVPKGSFQVCGVNIPAALSGL